MPVAPPLPIDEEAFARLQRGFVVGLARQPLPLAGAFGGLLDPADPAAALKALALAGQRMRFRRPAGVFPALAPGARAPDARTIVSDAARRLLLGFLAGKDGATDLAAAAVADALDRARLRLHPFDLSRLDGFVVRHADRLGAQAQAFADARTPREGAGANGLEAGAIDDDSWREARRADRLAYFAKRRLQDPAAARALLARDFAAFPADVRAPLLQALRSGLGPDDRPFLESAANDRAAGVREAAKALLARLPGGPEHEAWLADVRSRLKITRSGLLARRSHVRLELPADVTPPAYAWIFGALQGVGLARLAAALDMEVGGLVAAANRDAPLTAGLAFLASEELHFDILGEIAAAGGRDACLAVLHAAETLPQVFGDRARAQAWAQAAIQPARWEEMPPPWTLSLLYRALKAPLPEATAAALLHAACWRAWLAAEADKPVVASLETLVAAAALTPATLRPLLGEQLGEAVDAPARRALRLLEILSLLETGQPESDP